MKELAGCCGQSSVITTKNKLIITDFLVCKTCKAVRAGIKMLQYG